MVAFIKAMPTMDSSTYLRLATGSGDGSLPRRDANANAALTIVPGNPKSISPFVASNNDNRPYLPGDPQESSFSSPAATVLPRTGYVSIDRSDLVSACVTCHGSENTGRPGGAFPNLTLQSPQYIYDSLHAFASGQRQSGIMWLVAGNLSDDQMRSLALQIGASPARASRADTEDVNATATTTARGDDIAHAGIGGPAGAERCTSCHVPGPEVDKIIPAIDGQNAAYFRAQMRLFRAGGRGDTTSYNPMIDESKNLSDADIAALADYYAAAPPRPKH
jgi:cytochrome c553